MKRLDRFDADVISEAPALTIWQVGTNAVFQDGKYDLDKVAEAIETGIERLRGLATDIVVMDLQYAPAILTSERKPKTERMVSLIAGIAEKAKINLFRRFALMKHWREVDQIPFEWLINPEDGSQLHQSDWSTRGVTKALCRAIVGSLPQELSQDVK